MPRIPGTNAMVAMAPTVKSLLGGKPTDCLPSYHLWQTRALGKPLNPTVMGDAIWAQNAPETIWWPNPIGKLTVFPRPFSWRSLIRRGVVGRGKEGMRKGKGGERQKELERNGREGDEKKKKPLPAPALVYTSQRL